ATKTGIPISGNYDHPSGPNLFTHCRVSYSSANGLSVDLVTSDGSQTNNILNGKPISWTAQADWRFLFTAAPAGQSLEYDNIFALIQNVQISGETAPYFLTSITNRTSNQDFTNQFDFNLDTLEGHPENVMVTAQSSNPAVFGSNNLSFVVRSATNRLVTLDP